MRRAHAYVVDYEDHVLSSVVLRERYVQRLLDPAGGLTQERTLLSDYLLFQLPPDEDWYALRDVYDVDGAPQTTRRARIEELFRDWRARRGDIVGLILEESARFNLAPDVYQRTVNVPTFALRLLRPSSRDDVLFRKIGEEEVGGTLTWVVAYREVGSPTFTGTPDDRDLPAYGSFWIEPETGVVVRSEMTLGNTPGSPSRVSIQVTYRLDPALDVWIPVEMRERYDMPDQDATQTIEAVAVYSDARPFDWRDLVPPPPP
jgi:hypothetical protein